jgi:hypothetical protein
MNFEVWYQDKLKDENSDVYRQSRDCMKQAFDAGWQEGFKEAARDIIQFIVDQGTIECGKDNPYFVVQDDLNHLREKFGSAI